MAKDVKGVKDGTCQGPGDVDGRCGRPSTARGLCLGHVQQFYRAGEDLKKLRPLGSRVNKLEARGRISPAAAELITRHGEAQLLKEGRKGNPLWRGTQVVLEAFFRGDLIWREGAAPKLSSAKPSRRRAARATPANKPT